MSNQKHHGIRERHSMDHLCNPKSYDYEREGRFGRLFRSKHHVAPLYTNPKDLIELGKLGGVMDSMGNKDLTKGVPLGMIFLGQFIDHDITFDTESRFNNVNIPTEIDNFRTPNLDLDCIFGEGPEDEPFLYEADSLKLITGESNKNLGQAANLEKEDLARNGQGKAIIGDPRNDENRVISQLQLLFIRFYNKVYDHVAAKYPADHAQSEIYEEARKITVWHYQWIVLHEFLPMMIGSELLNTLIAEGRKWYTPKKVPFMPVEFSVAAYRFGHSMIPQKLRLKAAGQEHDLFSDEIGGGFSKVTSLDQVIEWNQFFDLDGSHQLATKLDSKLSSELLSLPFLAGMPAEVRSLATRNLRRGNSFLLPSGQTVATCLGVDEKVIERVVDTALDLVKDKGVDLSNGIPLWFYILVEGQELGRDGHPGEGLGPVGGRIVGEVLYGLLELDHQSFLGANRNWLPNELHGKDNFTMKDLIAFATA